MGSLSDASRDLITPLLIRLAVMTTLTISRPSNDFATVSTWTRLLVAARRSMYPISR